jgi:hypothetical protein
MVDEQTIEKLIWEIKKNGTEDGSEENTANWLVLSDCLQEQGGKRGMFGEQITLWINGGSCSQEIIERQHELHAKINTHETSPTCWVASYYPAPCTCNISKFYLNFDDIEDRKYEYTWIMQIDIDFEKIMNDTVSVTQIHESSKLFRRLIEYFRDLSSYFPDRYYIDILQTNKFFARDIYHVLSESKFINRDGMLRANRKEINPSQIQNINYIPKLNRILNQAKGGKNV